jgi:ubiquitin conjugation factor E4 B
LTDHLLKNQEDDNGVCHEFLKEFERRCKEDESAQEAMADAIRDLRNRLAKITMNDDYKPYMLVSTSIILLFLILTEMKTLRNLVRYAGFVELLVQSPSFLPPDISAAAIETETILGPFFRISPLQGDVTTNYFSSPKTRDKNYIANSQNALRMTLRTHQTELFDIVNNIIRVNKQSRERILDWFAACVNTNHKRRAIQVDPATVSSDGFMVNVTVCLDQLCEPFMDATFSKIDRIDVNYLRRKPRVDIKDETKLNADQHASDEYYSVELEGQSNFISEVFFLNLAAHHYGSEATNAMLSQLEKDLKHLEKQVASMETERPKFASNPAQLAMFDRAVKKYADRIEKGLSYKFAVQGVLLDDLNQARSMQFMRYVIIWLLRVAAPDQDIPKTVIKLPLSVEQPEVFKCLPEYFLEDVVGNYKFIMRNMPHIITATQSDELVMLCVTFLRSSEYIRNPYLKSGLVTILFHGIWPVYGRQKGILGDLLNSLPFATQHLLHSLMKFYIEVENTGAHTQFYDKFNIRYEIFQIIKCIWSNPIYREHLSVESKVNLEFFVRFVNLLLNDVTFVLDESLSAFVKIHDLQQELARSPDMDPTLKGEKEEALADAQGKAKSYMGLTNETVAMLKLFTAALADSFTMPEIVQRLADMLDYNLDAMIGPKSSNLKVDNPLEYGFNPRVLLAEIVDVYLNLKDKENFIIAVARDGRSFKPSNFENATTILRKWGLKSQEDLQAWTALGERFKKAKEIDDQAEEDLGEIPDEFLGMLFTSGYGYVTVS